MKKSFRNKMAKRKKSNKKIHFIIIVFLVLGLSYIFFNEEKEGVEVSELQVKELKGNTVEERLSQYVNIENAKITLIEDVDSLKGKYSAIFKDAKDGHYLIELQDKILIYDFEHDRVVSEFYFDRISIG